MLLMPVTVSTSSGMWLQPIEPDASISSMMFGLTCTEGVPASGVLEMSVSAAWVEFGSRPPTSASIAASEHRVARQGMACKARWPKTFLLLFMFDSLAA